jgi:hypothetical protein
MTTIIQELIQHLSVDVERGMNDEVIVPYWSAKIQQVGLPFADASSIVKDIREGLSKQAIIAYWEAKLKLQCPDAIVSQPESPNTNASETPEPLTPTDWQKIDTSTLLTEFRRITKLHSYTSIANRMGGDLVGSLAPQLVSAWGKGALPGTRSNFRVIRQFVVEYNQGDHSGLYPPGNGRKDRG